MPSFSLSKKYCRISGRIFEQETHMRGDRIVAQDRVALLHEVADAEQRQPAEDEQRDEDDVERLRIVIEDADAEQQRRDDGTDGKNDETWRERKQQRFHGTLGQITPCCLTPCCRPPLLARSSAGPISAR
jgi:hypothetical protein